MTAAQSLYLAAVGIAVTAVPLHAQWSAEAQGGRIRSALDPAGRASESVMLGLRYDDANSGGLRVSIGVPTATDAPLWGGIGAARRLVLRRSGFVGGLDLAAHGFLLQDRAERTREIPGLLGPSLETLPASSGHALAGQALPLAGYESARWQAHARAGVSHYDGQFGEQSRARTVRLAEVQLTLTPTPSVALMPAVRWFVADEANYSYAGATGLLSYGRASVWGTVGHWLDLDDADIPWAAGAALRVHQRAMITATARRDVLDPLYLNPPNTSWSLGFALQLGRPAVLAPPVPAVYTDGRATIRLPATLSPTAPSIAGDFNDWKPQRMQRV
ncbi:MAG TPA: hypothetical protein VK864_07010, partial [Longimicrobiales bacterium]|nr:hypothetical protein [Longimicrobiales bacterium]